jgi:hypothetical protein
MRGWTRHFSGWRISSKSGRTRLPATTIGDLVLHTRRRGASPRCADTSHASGIDSGPDDKNSEIAGARRGVIDPVWSTVASDATHRWAERFPATQPSPFGCMKPVGRPRLEFVIAFAIRLFPRDGKTTAFKAFLPAYKGIIAARERQGGDFLGGYAGMLRPIPVKSVV